VRGLQNALLLLVVTCASGLFAYEMTAHSAELFGTSLPGWFEAAHADRCVHFIAYTHIPPVDRLVHESCEAAVYYSSLLR
jgi:hypothetical protein